MNSEIGAEVKGLVGDIFNLTGQKVEMDDPIVVAALIHSQLIQSAGRDAKENIQSGVHTAIVEMTEAIKSDRLAVIESSKANIVSIQTFVSEATASLLKSVIDERAGVISTSETSKMIVTDLKTSIDSAVAALVDAVSKQHQASAAAYSQILDAARAATESEAPKMHAQFSAIANEVLTKVRNEAKAEAPMNWKIKIALVFGGILLLGGVAGGVIGSFIFPQTSALPNVVKNQIAAGKDFMLVFPTLDRTVQDKVVAAIEKAKGGNH